MRQFLTRIVRRYRTALGRLLAHSSGATAVEYSVMLALILTVTIGAISQFGSETNGLWSGILGNLHTAGFMP